MGRIAIVTDSSANLPAELIEKYGIHIVPLKIAFGERVFRDGVDITPEEFYRMLRETDDPPVTSQPSPGEFEELYARLAPEAEAIVSIHISGGLSGTISSALAAREAMPTLPIHVVDSRTTSIALGFIVLEAAQVAAAGGTPDEVLAKAREMIPKVTIYGVLDTLEYLRRGGRIGRAASLLGSMLRIKPIFYLNDGVVDALEKPRTKARAVRRMVEIMAERVGAEPVRVAVLHADVPDEAERLREEVASRFRCLEEPLVVELTPVLGAHAGPGVLGLAYYAKGQKLAGFGQRA